MPNAGHASALTELLVREPGYEYFNSARGRVTTYPFYTKYAVRYHFVRTPRGYRLEIMHPSGERGAGFSPLHAAMWRPNGYPENHVDPSSYPVVHISYKVPNGDDNSYLREKEWLGRVADMGQDCTSEYGQFSYWLPPCADYLVWLKPRVNLRDES